MKRLKFRKELGGSVKARRRNWVWEMITLEAEWRRRENRKLNRAGEQSEGKWIEGKESRGSPCPGRLPRAFGLLRFQQGKQMGREKLQVWRLHEIFKMLHRTSFLVVVRCWAGGGQEKVWLIMGRLKRFCQHAALLYIFLLTSCLIFCGGDILFPHIGHKEKFLDTEDLFCFSFILPLLSLFPIP